MESTTVLHFLGWILIIWNLCSFEVSAVKQKKQTGVTGDQLLIGSLQPIPTIHKTLPSIAYYGILCTPGKYEDNFTLEIYKNSEGVTNKVELSDYFLEVYRSLWLCKPAGMPDSTDEFLSIDTVLISIKDIYSITYSEGCQVNLKKIDVDRVEVIDRLCVAKNKEDNTFSIRFKCLDDWRYNVTADGGLSNIPDLSVEILKNPLRTVDHEEDGVEDASYEDVSVGDRSSSISNNGPSLRIESSPSTIGKPNRKYVCQPSYVNTELFLPKCYQKIGDHYALIPQKEFVKRFIVFNRDVQICESGENDRIFRISHTVIGRTNISNIEYGNGITELYAIKLPDGGRSIRYTEVRNVYAKTRKPVMDHNVQLTFAHIELPKSLVVMETDGSFSPFDIDYKLPPGSIFRVLISPQGYNIRVGSRPVADIDADDVQCQIVMAYGDTHDSRYVVDVEIVIVDDNGLRHTLVHDRDLIHDVVSDQVIWSCASEKNKSVTFLRVSNYLKIREPIHYIETYDGVEFLNLRQGDGSYVLNILEIKYLLNGKAVRFVGQMKTVDEFFRAADAGSTPHAIKKGEIYLLPTNDIPTREHIPRDYQWDGEQYEHFENEKDQEKTMRLEVNGDSTLATNQPQVIICKAQETLVERFPFFKIIKGTELIESMQSDTDRTLNEKYFDNMKSEKWLCSEVKEKQRASTSSSPTEIVRVITKQTLRRPNDICVIEHTPLDRIWFEMFNNNYQTKIEEIRYYQKEGEQFKLYNSLNSHVILEHDPPTGVWKSGTKYLNNFNGKSKTIYKIVKLDEGYYEPVRMYHLNMTRSTEAFRTLLIGSKWTEIYGNHQTTLICVEDKELAGSEFSEKDSLYFTKISQQGTGEDNEYNFHDDFKLLTLKIWKCTDDANSESSLYGVMNTFTLRRDDNSLKEIIYYDGVTVIHGMLSNQRLHYEFTEFKYLNEADMSVVKFEGKVVMAQGSEPAQVTSELEEKSAKDTVPVLNQVVPGQNEVFLTKINNIGITLEIGEILQPDPYAGSILDLHCTSNDSSTIERIKSEGLHHPRISKFNSLHHSVVMTPEETGELFETSHALQECWVTEGLDIVHSSYYRVVTVLKLKNTNTLRQIYYYDEVNIHEADNELTIEVIQYMFLQVKENEDGSTEEGLIKVKLDHFRTLLPDVQFEERHMHHREKIDYRLDREKVQLSNGEGKGITIQVESQDDTTTIIGNPSEIVTCLKIKDLPVGDNRFNSKICSNIGSENEEIKYVDVSEFPDLEQVSQDIWRCSGDEDLKFLIVQNKMIIKDTKIRVYHKTQVSVGTLFLPNGEEVLLMSDEKFFLEEKTKDGQYEYNVVKIFGTVKYLLETLPEADTFLRHNIEAPAKILTERTNDHIWSLDSVRLLAFRDLKLAERRIQGVHYSGDIHQQDFHTMILYSGASRMFQLGRFYDKVLNTKDLYLGEPLKCIRFTWGSAFTPKYTPRVAEYVGRHLYTMDKQTFDENFQVIDVAVWLCTNKFDELLRVKTVYKPIQEVPIFAVRYADGIEVEVSRDGKHLIKVNEILYMDVLALNVYRYDGDLQERIVPAIPPVRVSSAESYHERDETMMREIQVEGPSKKSCVAAKGEAYLLASVNTLKALFECLKPFFKIPRLGKSRKPTQPPPGKLQELEVESA